MLPFRLGGGRGRDPPRQGDVTPPRPESVTRGFRARAVTKPNPQNKNGPSQAYTQTIHLHTHFPAGHCGQRCPGRARAPEAGLGRVIRMNDSPPACTSHCTKGGPERAAPAFARLIIIKIH